MDVVALIIVQTFYFMSKFTFPSKNFKELSIIQKTFWSLLFLMLSVVAVNAQITGSVSRDFNSNGTKDINEPLVLGVLIKAFDTAGAECASATSAGTASPNYTLTGCSRQVRVEFEISATGNSINSGIDFSTASGTTYGSSF